MSGLTEEPAEPPSRRPVLGGRLRHPVVALVVAATLIALIVVFAAAIIRTVRRWFSRRALDS